MSNADWHEAQRLLDSLVSYNFKCEAGNLENSKPFIELRALLVSQD